MCFQTLIVCPCSGCANALADTKPNDEDPRTAIAS